LLTKDITIGSLIPEAIYTISHINDNPFADVAVMALAPAASAPMHALIALCSLSTATNSVSTSPLSTYVEKYCGISVDGVIGNAATTSGFICFIAKAVASFPLNLSLILILFVLLFHYDCSKWTCFCTYSTTFAKIVIV